MFELIKSITIDAVGGVASGMAWLPAEHPLFADHFPLAPLAPGSLLIELSAQIAGPLAEEISKNQTNVERWAFLGMIREAKFLSPVPLPARITFFAEAVRIASSNIAVSVRAEVDSRVVMRAELVMMLAESAPGWEKAIDARHQRVAAWKGSA